MSHLRFASETLSSCGFPSVTRMRFRFPWFGYNCISVALRDVLMKDVPPSLGNALAVGASEIAFEAGRRRPATVELVADVGAVDLAVAAQRRLDAVARRALELVGRALAAARLAPHLSAAAKTKSVSGARYCCRDRFCRFGCSAVENASHVIIECPHFNPPQGFPQTFLSIQLLRIRLNFSFGPKPSDSCTSAI